MNLANKLTMIRIFLIPIFLIFIAVNVPYGKLIAVGIFIIAAITDKLDGYIARSRNMVTNFGKFMDPLADKLLVASALISLVEFHIIPTWIAMVIITREYAVTGLRLVAASEGIVMAASLWGKLKTATQIVAIIIAILNINYKSSFISTATFILMTAAVLITIISGLDYFIKNKKIIKFDR